MHIFNNNYTDKKITREINNLVGKPFPFLSILAKKGIGSTRMTLESFSPGLYNYFDDDHDIKKVNVELRPKGVVIYIKNKINDYKWVIPFYALHFYKTDYFSIHAHGNFLKFHCKNVFPANEKFFEKVMTEKTLVAIDFELPNLK